MYSFHSVAPASVHPAFDKGCHYLGVTLIHIPVDKITGKVDVAAVSRAITRNTIMIVGSTPSFPHGIVDDIPELSKLALKHKIGRYHDTITIGFHVDSCLGGFLIPFMKKAGYPLPFDTDFKLEGVTSISCDTHKYGFAPKGSSVIMYRSKLLRNYQYFVSTDWMGGVYGSPTMAGSRPGALSAGCWAAMMHFGESGYVDATKQIIHASRTLKTALSKLPNIKVIGDPILSVVAFQGVGEITTYGIADILSKKHWQLNILQFPSAIHIAVTMPSVKTVNLLINDIKEAIDTLKKNPGSKNGETAAIYGTAASVPDRSMIQDVTFGFLDALTKI